MKSILAYAAAAIALVAAQDAPAPNTCPALQTFWSRVPTPRNGNKDFGAPVVSQGKAKNGQPKAGGPRGPAKFRNLILIIPDGFGPASEVFARTYVQWNNTQTGWNRVLGSDTVLIGSIRTRASDSWVTDSAASATAYSSAVKTFNGGIAVDENGNPTGTVLEAAKLAGYATGLVVTSRITHATPACFASHNYDRDDEANIAQQLVGDQPLGPVVDVLLGGGLGFFLPNSTKGSSRKDSQDVLAYARGKGYHTFTDRAGFDALSGGSAKQATKPYIGLFHNSHMNYEIDRDPAKEPSLLEMTKTAIRSLERKQKDSKKGFFLMVEASRIDHAGHGNDLVGHLHDIIQYNDVVDYLKSYVDRGDDGETVLIGTADHECGGLTIGGIENDSGEYQYVPDVLAKASHSSSYLAAQWAAYNGSDPDGYLTGLFAQYGIFDANSTEIEVAKQFKASASANEIHIGQSLLRRAMMKWGSTGHTGVDVNLIGYAKGKGQKNLDVIRGNHDNTEVGLFIANELGLDLPHVASLLNARKNEEWLVKIGRDKVEGGVHARKRKRDMTHHHGHVEL